MGVTTSLIVAASENDVIGLAGGLPWHLPEDLRRFKRLTTGHALVAGRKTHESIVERLGRSLPDRTTVVVTRRPEPDADEVRYRADVAAALQEAADVATTHGQREIFVIGGAQIYARALTEVDRVYLTRVHRIVDGDAAMPTGWLDAFALLEDEPAQSPELAFLTYVRR